MSKRKTDMYIHTYTLFMLSFVPPEIQEDRGVEFLFTPAACGHSDGSERGWRGRKLLFTDSCF